MGRVTERPCQGDLFTSQLDGEAVVSVDPSGYQTGPDPLQFTVKLPKIATMQESSPERPN